MKIDSKIKEVGLKNVVVGSIKKVKYKKYYFDSWHLSPYEW